MAEAVDSDVLSGQGWMSGAEVPASALPSLGLTVPVGTTELSRTFGDHLGQMLVTTSQRGSALGSKGYLIPVSTA